MIEYVNEDAKDIGESLKTLILKCAESNSNELECTCSFGELYLDCHFEFSVHKEGEMDG